MDWDRVAAYAAWSLAPLVLYGLARRAPDVAPRHVLETLRMRRDRLQLLEVRRRSVLRELIGVLEAASVPAIALKGVALGHLVYSDPVLRPMTDIDIWVPMSRLADGLPALLAHGFREPASMGASGPVANRVTSECYLQLQDIPVLVEVHPNVGSLTGAMYGSFEVAWSASREVSLGGIRARVLCPEHQLIHACLHLARAHHFESGLRHLVDVAWIVQRWDDTWDWPRLVREWEHQGVAEWALLALAMARDLLDAPVPQSLEAGVAGQEWPRMRAIAEHLMWEARCHHLPPAASALARSRSPGAALRWLGNRLVAYYWFSPEQRPLGAMLRDGGRRIWHDLTIKVPAYLRGWRRGQLRGTALAEGLALARSRGELEQLVTGARRAREGGHASETVTSSDVATRPPER